jgi:hypothetical protein
MRYDQHFGRDSKRLARRESINISVHEYNTDDYTEGFSARIEDREPEFTGQ